jgi:phosphoribosyl-AMP cyclohydrolase
MDTSVYFKKSELIPAVVQHYETKEVLMVGFVSEEALKLTLSSGKAWFFSRSRNKLWMKGETSGNVLKIVEIRSDCDDDTLLYVVSPAGPVCHTGNNSCFFKILKER